MGEACGGVDVEGGAIRGPKGCIHSHENRAGGGRGGATWAVVGEAAGGHSGRVRGAKIARLTLQARSLVVKGVVGARKTRGGERSARKRGESTRGGWRGVDGRKGAK